MPFQMNYSFTHSNENFHLPVITAGIINNVKFLNYTVTTFKLVMLLPVDVIKTVCLVSVYSKKAK